jgi:hypothetical protein
MIKKEAEKILKIKISTEIWRMWNVQAKVIPVITGNWNYLRIIQTKTDQHTGKARNLGTGKNAHIGHCTHTSENTNVKVQKHSTREFVAQTVNTEQLQHYNTLETWFVFGIIVNGPHECDNKYDDNNNKCD